MVFVRCGPPHRHIRDESLYESTGSFLLYSPQGGG